MEHQPQSTPAKAEAHDNSKPEAHPVKQFACPECGQDTLPLLNQPGDNNTDQIYYCLTCKALYKREF